VGEQLLVGCEDAEALKGQIDGSRLEPRCDRHPSFAHRPELDESLAACGSSPDTADRPRSRGTQVADHAAEDGGTKIARVYGFALMIIGTLAAGWAWLAMADPSTRTERWQLYLFGLGILAAGWGVPLVVFRWRRHALACMILATPLVAFTAYAVGSSLA
jgi:hypothetical protein